MTPRAYLQEVAVIVAGLLLIGAVCLAVSWRYLQAIGECALDRVVAAQTDGGFCLFGSGIEQDNFTYKLALYRRIHPAVVTLGSSRTMQLRGSTFHGSYLNLGGAVGSPAALDAVVDAVLREHVPELVLLGVDFWWFHPGYEPRGATYRPVLGSFDLTLERLKLPFVWVATGKVPARDVPAALSGGVGATCRLGVMARSLGDGFGPDGSYHYTASITGRREAEDVGFRETLARVAAGNARFEWSESADPEAVARVAGAIRRLEAAGAKVVAFLPPVAGPVLAAMRAHASQYGHLWGARKALAVEGVDVADFTDAHAFGSGDCEFVDGFHGGEITYLRMLDRLSAAEPALARRVDHAAIEALVQGWAGHATVADPRIGPEPEVDFLELGCRKPEIGGAEVH